MINLKLNNDQKKLRQRIIAISYKNRLSHIGSCLNVVDLVDGVYRNKKREDIFVLSAGHSAVALYAVLEKYKKDKKYDLITNIHPDRLSDPEVNVSTGSLGQGLPIAVGMALANKDINVFCLISDGECAEGSVWEAFRIINDKNINNISVILSANGYGAYDRIDTARLKKRIDSFGFDMLEIDGHNTKEIDRSFDKPKRTKPLFIFANTISEQLPFLEGQVAHYYVMKDDLATSKEVFGE